MKKQMGVYKIINRINNNCYIGSTTVNFKRRWKQHLTGLQTNTHTNQRLQRAFNKYGEEAFYLEIIEIIEDKDCIRDRERYWFTEIQPEYNILHVRDTDIHRLSKSHEKFRYHLVSPQGIHFCITNLTAFAKENNLADSHLLSVVKGKLSYYKGWRGTVIKEDGSLLHPLNWEPKDKYHLISPEGIHQCVWNLKEFAEENNILQSNLRQVVIGTSRSEQGWRGSIITDEGNTPYLNREPEHKYYLISPNGIEMSTYNLKSFAQEHQLTFGKLYLGVKTGKPHKGWRVNKYV